MVTGIVIPAKDVRLIEQREFTGLDDYRAAVDGWIEAIDLLDLGVTIYVNEEGRVRHLPFNSRASFLWWYHVPAVRQTAVLAGDAVVVGLPDRNGDNTDVPDAVRELLLTPMTYRVEVRTIGDPKWYGNQATYPDYWEAVVWAMVTLERWKVAEDVRVLPVDDASNTGGAV